MSLGLLGCGDAPLSESLTPTESSFSPAVIPPQQLNNSDVGSGDVQQTVTLRGGQGIGIPRPEGPFHNPFDETKKSEDVGGEIMPQDIRDPDDVAGDNAPQPTVEDAGGNAINPDDTSTHTPASTDIAGGDGGDDLEPNVIHNDDGSSGDGGDDGGEEQSGDDDDDVWATRVIDD